MTPFFSIILLLIIYALLGAAVISAVRKPDPDPAVGQLWESGDHRLYVIIRVTETFITLEPIDPPGDFILVISLERFKQLDYTYIGEDDSE